MDPLTVDNERFLSRLALGVAQGRTSRLQYTVTVATKTSGRLGTRSLFWAARKQPPL